MSKHRTGRSSNTQRVRRVRAKMMAEDPHCWRCHREVTYFYTAEGPLPDDFATIGHVYSWNIPPQERPAVGEWRLECFRCNQDQGKMEQQLRQLQERWNEEQQGVLQRGGARLGEDGEGFPERG